MILDDGRLSQE